MSRQIRYLINPAASVKSMWFPGIHQLVVDRPNKSYFNSLWIGTVSNLFTLPYRVATEVVLPLFHFHFVYAALAVVLVPTSTMLLLYSGLCGRASGVEVTMAQRLNSAMLSEQHGREALEQGCDLVVLDLLMLIAQGAGQLPEGMVIPGFPAKKSVG